MKADKKQNLKLKTSCAGGRYNIPRRCKLTFDLLTLKVMSKSESDVPRYTPCPQKSKPNFLTITLKVVNELPSNLARSISDKCLTMWHRNYPFHLMH